MMRKSSIYLALEAAHVCRAHYAHDEDPPEPDAGLRYVCAGCGEWVTGLDYLDRIIRAAPAKQVGEVRR